ncbi:hypothetical protein DPMN_149803 [Dreissena polymorpha]|uniref:Ig-like domain-containing protein n=1 Tax=Dreissena polymorpha TaxID=45954 RepID=A0A9D4J2S2_DREPO|nr:hypothetical protein DPMN_149803 [Dreissena polymorpha]
MLLKARIPKYQVASSLWLHTTIVSFPDLPLFTVYPRNITVNQSDTMTLNCLGQARNDPTVRWYRGQSGDLTPIQPSNRVVISPGGSLALQVWRQEK